MSWPTPQEYNESIQNPLENFSDCELQSGIFHSNRFGLPIVASGSFASVYRFNCVNRELAVRCFLKDIPDQQERYDAISRALLSAKDLTPLPQLVDFEYLAKGIRVGAAWYPIVKMEWNYGLPLDIFLKQKNHNKRALQEIANNFKSMVQTLNELGIAHGDLQHGNILISAESKCTLVDYDGMFVPSLKERTAHELGHRNYQHPARDYKFFNNKLDNFAAWSIYTALLCMAEDPSLLDQLTACDECLLFRQADYKYPLKSLAFYTLENHESALIRKAAKVFRSLLDCELDKIPYLGQNVTPTDTLPPITEPSLELSTTKIESDHKKKTSTILVDRRALSAFPQLNDYIAAISNPGRYCSDAELKDSILVLEKGQIQPIGQRGSVFKFRTPAGNNLAAKVFFSDDTNREERYHILNEFLSQSHSELARLRPYLVPFDYKRQGICVHGLWYPMLIMEWIDGPTLFDAVDSAVSKGNKDKLRSLAREFKELMAALRKGGIVHGDIEPENIIVTKQGLRLIDYDFLKTPISANLSINEMGNKHFQHPKGSQYQQTSNDNFAAWLVYTSLIILSIEPGLWNQTGVKPGRLLFHRKDIANPAESVVFGLLENHYSQVVRSLVSQLKMFALWEPDHVPMLFDDSREKAEAQRGTQLRKRSSTKILPTQMNTQLNPVNANTGEKLTISQSLLILGVLGIAAIMMHSWILLGLISIMFLAVLWSNNRD